MHTLQLVSVAALRQHPLAATRLVLYVLCGAHCAMHLACSTLASELMDLSTTTAQTSDARLLAGAHRQSLHLLAAAAAAMVCPQRYRDGGQGVLRPLALRLGGGPLPGERRQHMAAAVLCSGLDSESGRVQAAYAKQRTHCHGLQPTVLHWNLAYWCLLAGPV